MHRIAQVYLTDAYYGYIRPSPVAKVRDLEVKYPQFLSQITPREKTEILANLTNKSKPTSEDDHAHRFPALHGFAQ